MTNWFVNKFAEEIWKKKYAGKYENIDDYLKAITLIFSSDKRHAKKIIRMLREKKFSPAGRILAYAGNPDKQVSLMNCTTHAIEDDSLESISNTAYKIMRASSRGQGIGITLNKLRPKDAPVNNAAITSTGAISFMEVLNSVGSVIGQQGRRGALLFALSVDHPDLYRPEDHYDFLHIKSKEGKIESANISVMVTEKFMRAVENDEDWTMHYEGLSDGKRFEVKRTLPAKDLFMTLSKCAWESAEPGILFWDTAKDKSNSDLFGYPIVGVNPCAEQVLEHEGVCNLGSMNLYAYVKNPFTSVAEFDFNSFYNDVGEAIEFLDNALEVELHRGYSMSERQRQAICDLRRVGLGVMGYADALAALGISYTWDKRLFEMTRSIMMTFRNAAYVKSIQLGLRKGVAPVWKTKSPAEIEDIVLTRGYFEHLPKELQESIIQAGGTRNISLLSIAPTGTISNLYGVSSGIEPLFAKQYKRLYRMNGQDEFIDYIHPQYGEAVNHGVSDVYLTAYEVPPKEHVKIQAWVQRFIDQSISKTVNLPADASVEDVAEIYMQAWKSKLKGLSVYRDGSRTLQVLYTEKEESPEVCPECKEPVVNESGCISCPSCGWSKCEL